MAYRDNWRNPHNHFQRKIMKDGQSIIVYHSQLHKSVDEAIMSGEFFPVFGVLMAGVFVFCVLHSMLNAIRRKKRIQSSWLSENKINHYSAIIAGITVYVLGKWTLF